MTKDEILALLPTMRAIDRKEVLAALVALDKTHKAAVSHDTAGPYDLLWQALVAVTETRLGWQQFSRSKSYRLYRHNAPHVAGFIAQFGALTKPQEFVLMKLLLNLLKQHLVRQGLMPSVHILTANLGNVTTAFDAAFPGYRQSGLMHLIIDAILKPKAVS